MKEINVSSIIEKHMDNRRFIQKYETVPLPTSKETLIDIIKEIVDKALDKAADEVTLNKEMHNENTVISINKDSILNIKKQIQYHEVERLTNRNSK